MLSINMSYNDNYIDLLELFQYIKCYQSTLKKGTNWEVVKKFQYIKCYQSTLLEMLILE